MSLEGNVVIDLRLESGRVRGVTVTPPRPISLLPLLAARPAADAVAYVGALFRVCGLAQATAAVEAAESAMGLEIHKPTHAARHLLVAAETLREHLLRICWDAAFLDGRTADAATLRRAMALPTRLKAVLFGSDDPFGPGFRLAAASADGARELARDLADLVDTCVAGGTNLGSLDRAVFSAWAAMNECSAARLAAGVFARDWTVIGCPRPETEEAGLPDTSCLARQSDRPLVRALLAENGTAGLGARLAARLVEAQALAGEIAAALVGPADAGSAIDRGDDLPPGFGRAEAARGRLEHRVVLDGDGRIADYAISAPTSIRRAPNGRMTSTKFIGLNPGS